MISKYKSLDYAARKRDEFGHIADRRFKRYEGFLPKNKFRNILRVAITSQYKDYQHT